LEVGELISIEDRYRFNRFEAESAVLVPHISQSLRDPVLHTNLFFEPGHCANSFRHGAFAVEPGGNAIIGQLWRDCGPDLDRDLN
jgi:hypothetical protein